MITPHLLADLERDFRTVLEIEATALEVLYSAKAELSGHEAADHEERLLRVIALRLIEEGISIWQDTSGERMSLNTLAALIPSYIRNYHHLSQSSQPDP